MVESALMPIEPEQDTNLTCTRVLSYGLFILYIQSQALLYFYQIAGTVVIADVRFFCAEVKNLVTGISIRG